MCQKNKVDTIKPLGLFQPLHILNQRWEEISMDFITGLPKSQGKDAIFVVVDKLVNYDFFCGIQIT